MVPVSRYRQESGRSVIDFRVRHSGQLFDGRDPAPFRERDLDEHAVRYLLDAAQEIPRANPLKIVVTVSEEPQPVVPTADIAEAVRSHFRYERDQVQRRFREHVRRGRMALVVGLAALFLFLSLAGVTESMVPVPFREILREGFVIMGWVSMWRPLEALLYDWWPMVDERRQITRLLEAELAVRHEATLGPGL